MAFDVEAAKADGYTDEEIQEYLANKGKTLPQEKPIDRTEEQWGTVTSAIPTALELGAGGYAAKKILESLRGPTGPATPPPTGATQRIAQSVLGSPSQAIASGAAPVAPAMPAPAANAVQGAAAAEGAGAGNWMAQALNMAKQYAPAMARMGAGLGAATYSGGLNTNEEAELARRRARELEQARRQGWIQ